MATWTTLPDASLEPGKPIRSIDGLALRDNPIAIAEGQAGAPKIVDAALGTSATNTGRDWVLARTALAEAGAVGSYVFARSNGSSVNYGDTIAGSSLRPSTASSGSGLVEGSNNSKSFYDFSQGSALSGTWRAMGQYVYGSTSYQSFPSGASTTIGATLWLRIS